MDVLMPQLGETVTEGKITRWYKSVGDAVEPGDNLFEIETDKTSMEVPAISAGVLAEVRVEAGTVAAVGAIVAVISEEGKVAAKPAAPPIAIDFPSAKSAGANVPSTGASVLPLPVAAPQRDIAVRTSAPLPSSVGMRPAMALEPFREVRTPERNYGPARLSSGATATPFARRLAAEAGIDLARITPSGPHARIMARDIGIAMAAAGGRSAAAPVAEPAARPPASFNAAKVKALYAPGTYEEVALDSMRRTIAARLVEAKQTIPHFYLTTDVELDALMEAREQANAKAKRGPDGKPLYRLSVNDFLIKALAAALQRVPAANAAWAEDRILYFEPSDISVAVAIEGGLITPVLRNVEKKSIAAVSTEMRELAARAKARKLKPEEYQGGSTTISNLGMFGVREFSAIINPPQATILAIGAAERRPVEAKGGGIQFVTRMTVTMSCDHRVVDGALGAELLATFKGFVEQPLTALV